MFKVGDKVKWYNNNDISTHSYIVNKIQDDGRLCIQRADGFLFNDLPYGWRLVTPRVYIVATYYIPFSTLEEAEKHMLSWNTAGGHSKTKVYEAVAVSETVEEKVTTTETKVKRL